MTDNNDEIRALRALLAEQTARADKAEAGLHDVLGLMPVASVPAIAFTGHHGEYVRAVVDAVCAERDAAIAACVEMRAALRGDTPYPVPDLLERFAEVADALLHRHDYDGHGWELIQSAMEHARDAAPNLRDVLSRPDLGAGMVVVPREMVEEGRLRIDLLCRAIRTGEAHGFPDELHGGIVDEAIRGEAFRDDLDALLKKGGG